MLRKIRQTLAVLFFTAITLLFLDFTGTVHWWLGWTTKIQFLASGAGSECRGDSPACGIDVPLWAHLLLCYLSVGGNAGHCVSDKRNAKEKEIPFLLFTRKESVALWCARSVRPCNSRGNRLISRLTVTIQLIRTHRAEPFCPNLPRGEQRTGLSGGTCG